MKLYSVLIVMAVLLTACNSTTTETEILEQPCQQLEIQLSGKTYTPGGCDRTPWGTVCYGPKYEFRFEVSQDMFGEYEVGELVPVEVFLQLDEN